MSFYRPPTTQSSLDGLGSVYRAVRAWKFYPKGHPSRRSSLCLAHAAMLQLLDGNTLLLACGRTGFSFPDGEFLKDASGMSTGLAYELFVRRVQKITFSHDLFQEDLLELLKIVSLSPERIQQSGGMDTVMAERGIRSIWVNEFDLATIRRKREKIEQAGIIPQGIEESENGSDSVPDAEPQLPQPEVHPEQQLQTLLGRIASCTDDDIYLILVRQAVVCADSIRLRHEPHALFPLIELLASHSDDKLRSQEIRECAQFAIEQIFMTGDLLPIVLESLGRSVGVTQAAVRAVLVAGGAPAITAAVELMGRTASLKTRKTLSTLLGSMDDHAVPVLLNLLNDSRWFIVRNICAILGAIASRDALPAVMRCLHHTDIRVRKEAIRSLAQIGGDAAESAILAVLRSSDSALHPQAIVSLGGMKSKKSLADLLNIVVSRDMFLKTLSLKIDAVHSIASIGERQVVPQLITIMEERHLLAAVRGRQLKSSVAACLGKLGDVRALPVLAKLASNDGTLGTVCAEAISMIEKNEGRSDGIS